MNFWLVWGFFKFHIFNLLMLWILCLLTWYITISLTCFWCNHGNRNPLMHMHVFFFLWGIASEPMLKKLDEIAIFSCIESFTRGCATHALSTPNEQDSITNWNDGQNVTKINQIDVVTSFFYKMIINYFHFKVTVNTILRSVKSKIWSNDLVCQMFNSFE